MQAGQIVAQRYELVRLLGEGGMGQVWSAIHTLTRKAVAIKILKPAEGNANAELVARFVREARAASAVRHPNVVAIHDILQLEDGTPLMVMDLLEGETLAARLARQHVLSYLEVARLLAPVVSAVGSAHALGIVHRDLKPENIFLTLLGDGRVEPMVLDFGIAKMSDVEGDVRSASNLTRTGSMLGTPYYMSPEQIYGEKDLDYRADIWALGVILYECLCGRRPFEGENFGQLLRSVTADALVPLDAIAPQLPVEITSLVSRMLVRARADRLSDLREVHRLLRARGDASASSFGPATVMTDPEASANIRIVTGLSRSTASASIVVTDRKAAETDSLHASSAGARPKAKRVLYVGVAVAALVVASVVGSQLVTGGHHAGGSNAASASEGTAEESLPTKKKKKSVEAESETTSVPSAASAAPEISQAPKATPSEPQKIAAPTRPAAPSTSASTKADPPRTSTTTSPGGVYTGLPF
jgi:eukaryotic-like serine/threonine-protein kinase